MHICAWDHSPNPNGKGPKTVPQKLIRGTSRGVHLWWDDVLLQGALENGKDGRCCNPHQAEHVKNPGVDFSQVDWFTYSSILMAAKPYNYKTISDLKNWVFSSQFSSWWVFPNHSMPCPGKQGDIAWLVWSCWEVDESHSLAPHVKTSKSKNSGPTQEKVTRWYQKPKSTLPSWKSYGWKPNKNDLLLTRGLFFPKPGHWVWSPIPARSRPRWPTEAHSGDLSFQW